MHIVFILVLIITNSRSGLVCFLISFPLLLNKLNQNLVRNYIFIFASLLIIVTTIFTDELKQILFIVSRTINSFETGDFYSAMGRIRLWVVYFNAITENPILFYLELDLAES